MDKNVDIGRMGENIVTNELLARGFLVTHLDKGTRGVSANADLMVGHPRLSRPILIQVKACHAPRGPDFVFLGNLTEDVLHGREPVYNRKPGFRADYLAAVSITDAKTYRTFIIPIQAAEELVLRTYRAWHAHPTRTGIQRKVVPKVYLNVTEKRRERAGARSQEIYQAASEALAAFEDRYDDLLTDAVKSFASYPP